MNKVILMARLTRDPDIRYTTGNEPKAVARFTLAADRRFAKRDDTNAQTADFIPCVAFGKQAEFAEKYLRQGTKIAVVGHLQSGKYQGNDGNTVYTLDVIVEEFEFAESKGPGNAAARTDTNAAAPKVQTGIPGSETAKKPMATIPDEGFMDIPDGSDDESPFA